MEEKHKNSHIVFLRRLPQFASAARRELEDYFAESKRSVGGYFSKNSVRTATGLTPTEEDLLMPYILSIPKEDRDFRKEVTKFFEGIDTKVLPKEGTPLEIGLNRDNNEPVSADNLPISITDYIRYRHALGHPWVAADEANGIGNQLKQYYFYDPATVSKANIDTNEERDKAIGYYLTLKDNKRSVDMYLTLLGVRTDQIKPGEEVYELRKLVDKDPKKFLALYNDRDKEMKYIIEDMINKGILERIGKSRIVIKDTTEELGRDMKETILFLSDSKNTKTYQALRARLQEAWKDKSISVDTDADLPKQQVPKVPAPAPIVVDTEEEPATQIIPAAAPETQVAAEDSAGALDD